MQTLCIQNPQRSYLLRWTVFDRLVMGSTKHLRDQEVLEGSLGLMEPETEPFVCPKKGRAPLYSYDLGISGDGMLRPSILILGKGLDSCFFLGKAFKLLFHGQKHGWLRCERVFDVLRFVGGRLDDFPQMFEVNVKQNDWNWSHTNSIHGDGMLTTLMYPPWN